jgi:thioredoxin
MREILWIAAAAVLVMLAVRVARQPALPDPPADEWFNRTVVQPSQTRPVLVKFGAEWCGPCRRMESELDQLQAELGEDLLVVRVDVDERRDLADHFGIGGIPDAILFREGRAVDRGIGYMNADALEQWVQPWLP